MCSMRQTVATCLFLAREVYAISFSQKCISQTTSVSHVILPMAYFESMYLHYAALSPFSTKAKLKQSPPSSSQNYWRTAVKMFAESESRIPIFPTFIHPSEF